MDSIMKKTAFIIGLISLLTACNSGSDDRFMELPDTPAGKASISFDGARTRASLNTISSTFALYGIATDAGNTSVVFNNQKIEYNNESTLWVYSPLKYWNTQADHKFGAYAPYNSSRNFSFNPEGFPMITGFMVSQGRFFLYSKINSCQRRVECKYHRGHIQATCSYLPVNRMRK